MIQDIQRPLLKKHRVQKRIKAIALLAVAVVLIDEFHEISNNLASITVAKTPTSNASHLHATDVRTDLAVEINTQYFANQHYKQDSSGDVCYAPTDGCCLSVPQPYYLDTGYTTGKSLTIAFALTINADSEANNVDWILFRANSMYQFVILPVSAVTMVVKVWNMGPFDSAWKHYLCGVVAVGDAPYVANTVLTSITWMTGQVCTYACRTQSKEALARSKMLSGVLLFYATFLVLFLLALPGFFTNAIVGAFVFMPVPLVLWFIYKACCAILHLAFPGQPLTPQDANVLHQGQQHTAVFYEHEIREIREHGVIRVHVIYVTFCAVLVSLGYQLLVVLTTYWYDGLSWWDAVKVTFAERQIALYSAVFISGILTKFAWCSQLMNQIF